MANAIDPPVRSETVDISAATYVFTSKKITAIYCNAPGTVIGRLWGDAADSTWVVTASQYLLGCFKSVTKAGTTLTAAGNMVGVTGYPNEG